MPIVSSTRVIELISNSKNPKMDILKHIGDLSGAKVHFNLVLVATYIRPAKTSGGIIRPDSNVGEDEWQGKVGLVLKLGSRAFKDDNDFEFGEDRVSVGEWVVYKVGDATPVILNGYPCRWVKDSSIKMTVKDPNMVF
jgi:co-chaperonin GroES (HSP10)